MKYKSLIKFMLVMLLASIVVMCQPTTVKAAKTPSKVTDVECINSFTTSAQISFDKANNASGYEINVYSSQGKFIKTQYTKYTKVSITGLTPGTKYNVTVKAYSWTSKGTRKYGVVSKSIAFATVPSKITDVKIKAATNNSITLGWKYNKNVTGYLVYTYDSKVAKWKFVKSVTSNKFVAENMNPGVNYQYVIKPYVYCGGKRYVGAEYKKTIMAQPADVEKIEVVEQNYSSIKVKWDKAYGATGYRVAIYDDKGECKLYYYTGSTSATFKNLDFRKRYTVVVRSYRLFNGSKRIYGGYVSNKIYTKLGVVKNLAQTNASNDSITISYSKVEGANLYGVYLYNKENGKKRLIGKTPNNSYKIDGLNKNEEYEIVVVARLEENNKTYYGGASQPICVYTYPDGITKYNVSDNTETGFTVSWEAVPMAAYYRVYYKDAQTGKYVFASNTKKTTYKFDCFRNGTQCYFAVVAVCTIGKETYVCPKTPGSGWTVENQLELNAGYTKEGVYVLSWKASATATGYEVYKYDDGKDNWIEVENTTDASYTYTVTDEDKVHRFKVRAYVKTDDNQIIRGDFSDEVEINKGKWGMDVSKWQGNINWEKVADSGIEFVIIKVGGRGYGKAGNLYEDPYFKENIEGALANGIEVGIYFFSTAISEKEAIEEAEWTLDRIKEYNVTYPIVFDYEGYDDPDYRSYGQTRTNRSNYAIAFLDYVRAKGYIPMMYASQYYYNAHWDTDRLSDYNLWVAKYPSGNNGQLKPGSEPKINYPYVMWQYSSTGKVNGINANVDMNYQYTSFKK